MVQNVKKNPGRALDFTANVANAVESKNPKTTSASLPEVINFYHTGRRLNLGEFVYFMLYKWKKKHQSYIRLLHYWSPTMI